MAETRRNSLTLDSARAIMKVDAPCSVGCTERPRGLYPRPPTLAAFAFRRGRREDPRMTFTGRQALRLEEIREDLQSLSEADFQAVLF